MAEIFSVEVSGPVEGSAMAAFVEFYDAAGQLSSPAGVLVYVEKFDGEQWVEQGVPLRPGDKGVGKCEFAPLIGKKGDFYRLAPYSLTGEILCSWATLDMGAAPIAPSFEGQKHKSWTLRYRPKAAPVPPPTPDCLPYIAALREIGEIVKKTLGG